MAKDSAIEWCDSTWSPWRGCTKVSDGCAHCYAERRAKRVGEDFGTIVRSKTTFNDPLKWKTPRVIFVGHLSDFFHPDVPREWVFEAWVIMLKARDLGHTFLLLTKRPENILNLLPFSWDSHHSRWDHIWLGITAEDQESYDRRILPFLSVPAAHRFVSFEPLLGSIDLRLDSTIHDAKIGEQLSWVIVGGESGPGCRKMEPAWVMRMQNDCAFHDIPFFFKQWGGTKKVNGTWGGRMYMGYFFDNRPEELS
jgi:protein gp37